MTNPVSINIGKDELKKMNIEERRSFLKNLLLNTTNVLEGVVAMDYDEVDETDDGDDDDDDDDDAGAGELQPQPERVSDQPQPARKHRRRSQPTSARKLRSKLRQVSNQLTDEETYEVYKISEHRVNTETGRLEYRIFCIDEKSNVKEVDNELIAEFSFENCEEKIADYIKENGDPSLLDLVIIDLTVENLGGFLKPNISEFTGTAAIKPNKKNWLHENLFMNK